MLWAGDAATGEGPRWDLEESRMEGSTWKGWWAEAMGHAAEGSDAEERKEPSVSLTSSPEAIGTVWKPFHSHQRVFQLKTEHKKQNQRLRN